MELKISAAHYNKELIPWSFLILGLVALYGPTFFDLFTTVWNTDEQAHGPLVMGISCWLLYRNWREMLAAGHQDQPSKVGWPILVIGLLSYIIGRSQEILILEAGSIVPTLAGLLLLTFGGKALQKQWFGLFFMIFMIPLPGMIVDAVTMPMKSAVSYAAAQVLYAVGYPIARTGVTLQVGPYKLMVADACAGLHTLFSLEALGLLYLNVVRHNSLVRNVALAILIVPISFTANVIRVICLTLITYHLGDEAGQGFLHGFAGMVLFLSALVLIIFVDSLLRIRPHRQASTS